MPQVVIDAEKMSLDEIMATLRLTPYNSIYFNCKVCGKKHKMASSSWWKCFSKQSYRNYHQRKSFVVNIEKESLDVAGETGIDLNFKFKMPKLYIHKLILYSITKAAKLLADYANILIAAYQTFGQANFIFLFDKQVPFSLMLTYWQYRELVNNILSSTIYRIPFEKFKQALVDAIQFVLEYPDLFETNHPSNMCVIVDKNNPKEVLATMDNKRISLTEIISLANIHAREPIMYEFVLTEEEDQYYVIPEISFHSGGFQIAKYNRYSYEVMQTGDNCIFLSTPLQGQIVIGAMDGLTRTIKLLNDELLDVVQQTMSSNSAANGRYQCKDVVNLQTS